MPRKQKSIHYLYKTTCLVTGRYYIGMHSTNNLEDGYMGSGKRLRYSIRKYGKENHVKEILEFFDSRELLVEAEKKVVSSDLIKDKMCMNIVEGGTGGNTYSFVTKESKEKMLNGLSLGRVIYCDRIKNDLEFRNKMLRVLAKNRLDSINSGKFKNNKTFKGKNHSEKTKLLMSEKAKQRIGDKNSQYGTMWITNGIENRKIKKEDVIPAGWYKGRK